MEFGHIHVGVKDLEEAVSWMEKRLQIKPIFRNAGMASYSFGSVDIILDKSDNNAPITIAFNSKSCDEDFERIKATGAWVIEAPVDRSWGVRVGYIKGPGEITFEIEQSLR